MFVSLWVLVPATLLALLAASGMAIVFDACMRDRGLCLIGRYDQYLPGNVLRERWCILYLPVFNRFGCHSYSDILG